MALINYSGGGPVSGSKFYYGRGDRQPTAASGFDASQSEAPALTGSNWPSSGPEVWGNPYAGFFSDTDDEAQPTGLPTWEDR